MRPQGSSSRFGSTRSGGIAAVPCMMFRGGTSRGLFFSEADLPVDRAARDRVLLAAMGSPHPMQLDGVGGGNPLTSKVAIVGKSADRHADVDYLFAQVAVDRALVDTDAACGNILSAVGPYAIETGMVAAGSPRTDIRIRSVNTGAITVATLSTPGGTLRYDGAHKMPGLATSAAPIKLRFAGAAGALTGRLLPAGAARTVIDGVEVSLVDYAIPVMVVAAEALGLAGGETAAEIDADPALLARVETIRRQAGRLMGLGDVTASVTPKVALVSRPAAGGTLRSRYLTPWRCHASHAVTGALCLAAARTIEGTVAAEFGDPTGADGVVEIEHPAGLLRLETEGVGATFAASVVRTARLLFAGQVYVPADVLQAPARVASGGRKPARDRVLVREAG